MRRAIPQGLHSLNRSGEALQSRDILPTHPVATRRLPRRLQTKANPIDNLKMAKAPYGHDPKKREKKKVADGDSSRKCQWGRSGSIRRLGQLQKVALKASLDRKHLLVSCRQLLQASAPAQLLRLTFGFRRRGPWAPYPTPLLPPLHHLPLARLSPYLLRS